jgi:hypothetical protein
MRVNWNLEWGLVACLIGLTGMSEGALASAVAPVLAPQESGQTLRPHETRTVIASVKVSPSGDKRYELSISPCRQKECPFQVRLLQGKTVLTSVNMDWVKASGIVTKETVDESSGSGDPLRPDTDRTAWSTGAEKENVSTVDVLKRHHDLFVAVNMKLVLAWSDADGPGPSWSTVALSAASKDGSQDMLSFRGFRSLSDSDPDRLNFYIYHWNSSQKKLVETQAPEVYAVIAGTYESVPKARAVRNAASCLDPFWILRSDAFSTLTSGKFVLAAVTGRKELAEKKADAVRACTTQLNISIISSPYHQPDE